MRTVEGTLYICGSDYIQELELCDYGGCLVTRGDEDNDECEDRWITKGKRKASISRSKLSLAGNQRESSRDSTLESEQRMTGQSTDCRPEKLRTV